MRYFLYIFILASTISCHAQKIGANHKITTLSYRECEHLFETNKEKLKSNPINNFKSSFNSWPPVDIKDSLITILNCGVIVMDKNIQRSNRVKNTLLSFTEKIYISLQKNKDLTNHVNAYKIADVILSNIPSEEAFVIGMKYFVLSKEDSFYHFSDDFGMINLGLSAFKSMLLPMMDEKSKIYYEKLYEDKLLDYTLNTLEDENFYKLFHAQFYPLIKADWESGKIKLRKPSKE